MPRLFTAAGLALVALCMARAAQGYTTPPTPPAVGRRAFADRVVSSLASAGLGAALAAGVGGGAAIALCPRAALASENMAILASTSSGLAGATTVSYEDFTTILLRGEAAKVRCCNVLCWGGRILCERLLANTKWNGQFTMIIYNNLQL